MSVSAEAPVLRPRIRALQRSEHRLLLAIGDTAAAGVAVLVALWAWSITTGFPFGSEFLWRWRAWWLVVPVWTLAMARARRFPLAHSLASSGWHIATAAVMLLGCYSVGYFYSPPNALPRLPAVYIGWEAALLTFGWRLVYLFVFTREGFRRRALVVGAGAAGERIVSVLTDLSRDVRIVAVIDDDPRAGIRGLPVHRSSSLDEIMKYSAITEIVIAGPLSPVLVQDLVRWQERGVAVISMEAEYEHLLMRVPVEYLDQQWMFTSFSEWRRARDASAAAKRALDIAGALVGALALALLAPAVAALILLDSGRPVFFRQRRLGAAGSVFSLVKFRTMVNSAEDEGPSWAIHDDPRTTRVGRWLRRSRLDELPQVLNVLRGEMSLVGPRPERPEFIERLERSIPFYRARLMVRPGLTGWAQVNEDYAASVDDATLKLEYDLYYIKHGSFLFDAWILLRTAATMLGLRGR